MKQTAVEYLFEKLWDTPKDKFAWRYSLIKAKNIEESNLLRYGAKCFTNGLLVGLSSGITGIIGLLILKFI
jgi:hypothetical protein